LHQRTCLVKLSSKNGCSCHVVIHRPVLHRGGKTPILSKSISKNCYNGSNEIPSIVTILGKNCYRNCQTITNDKSITRKIIATKIIPSSVHTSVNPKVAITNSVFRTATRSHILPTPILPNSNDAINKNEPYTNETLDFSSNEGRINNSTLGYNNTIGLDEFEYEKPINWTSGYGTHYGPFPSSPHFSEVGYQPQDVGVGCSDGRPGGDPRWKNILSKGVYPPRKF